jgi:prepilin-type N-terminal cleavage/methylation domain-containing protein
MINIEKTRNVETRFIVSNPVEMFYQNISTKKAFTLVELIVVITILAILATIWFMSYQSYTTDARDGKRKADLGELRNWLELYQAKKASLPIPDNYATIQSWITLLYQWYAGTSVLSLLRAWDSFQDTTDKQYYTYSIDTNKTKYQLLTMLENNPSLALNNNNLFNQTYAIDYTNRYPYTLWQNVWIYLSWSTKIPVQEWNSWVTVPVNTANITVVTTNSTNISTPSAPTTCPAGQWYNWTSCVTATSCTWWLTEITLANSQTWSCKNLWATSVRDGTTQPTNCNNVSTTNCNSSLTWLWDSYQWGRNDTGFTIWQRASPYLYGWESQNDTKWWGSSSDTTTADWAGTTKQLRQWPCPSGRHVPSVKDFQDMCNQVTWTTCWNGMAYNVNIQSVLKIPFAGFRNRSTGYYDNQSFGAYYWSSSPSTSYAFSLNIVASNINPTNNSSRASGFSVRCLKN